MDLSGFTTPKPERGTPARGTHVSSGQATPAQGSTATPAVPLCGTEARIAKQAQRREAREAERRAKRALLSLVRPLLSLVTVPCSSFNVHYSSLIPT